MGPFSLSLVRPCHLKSPNGAGDKEISYQGPNQYRGQKKCKQKGYRLPIDDIFRRNQEAKDKAEQAAPSGSLNARRKEVS
jgi:hypothetical protein